MHFVLQPWQFFFVILVGWVNREQQEIIEFYQTQLDAVMKAPGKKRLPLTDDQRRLLAIKGKSLGRKGKRRIAGGSCGITTHLDARVLPRAAFLDILSGKSLTAKSLAPEPPGDQKMLNQHRLARQHDVAIQPRREFLKQAGALALATSTVPLLSDELAAAADSKPPETLVKMLYDTLKENQRKEVCFEWNHIDKNRGLLRTRLENNWKITKPSIKSGFFSSDQQAMIRKIFEGMTHPGWHERWDEQLKGDVGGFGNNQSIAIFGEPGTDQFEFVLASRHMTLRCDGNSAEHVAFGGPILYAHDGEATFEKPTHPSNVFWHQAVAANKLYDMFDGNQREKALVINGMPSEELVGFRGPNGKFDGIAVTDFSPDQKEHLQSVLKLLLEPFRQSDRDEVTRCLKVQGGLDACRLAFYKEGDLGKDGIWDNWRLEGPSFVWYFRGKPHVHVWVNVADTPDIKLNSYQDSVGV